MKRVLSLLVKSLVSFVLIALLIRRVGVEALLAELRTARADWLVLAVGAFVLSNLLGAIQWRWFLSARGLRLGFWLTVGFYHVGLFFNNFLIGYVGGDVFRIYDAGRVSGKPAEAASAVFLDRIVGFIALTTMAVVASLFWMRRFQLGTMLVLAGSVLVLWMVALLTLFDDRIARRISPVGSFFLPEPIRRRISDVYWQLNAFRHERRLLARAFALSLLVQAARILVHYCSGRAVGIETSPVFFFAFIPIVALVTSLPITFGGIGVREQSAVVLFGQLGIGAESITAMEFLAYAVGVICSLPGGLYFLARKEVLRPTDQAEAVAATR